MNFLIFQIKLFSKFSKILGHHRGPSPTQGRPSNVFLPTKIPAGPLIKWNNAQNKAPVHQLIVVVRKFAGKMRPVNQAV